MYVDDRIVVAFLIKRAGLSHSLTVSISWKRKALCKKKKKRYMTLFKFLKFYEFGIFL